MELISKAYLSPLNIVRAVANFTKGEADNVRKAFAGKESTEILNKIEQQFIEGAIKNNISQEKALLIWNQMKTFASYGFNKSHAAVYSILTAKTAWLKAYYPTHFMTAIINSYMGKLEKVQQKLKELDLLNIELLPPSLNSSELFSVEGDAIRFGFKGIRGLASSSSLIVNELKENGAFHSLDNFFERMLVNRDISKTTISTLIYSGVLDCFNSNRFELESQLNNSIAYYNKKKEEKKKGIQNQISFFDFDEKLEESLKPNFSFDPISLNRERTKILSQKEKELTGLYITYNPLSDYLKKTKNNPEYKEIYKIVELPIENHVDESELAKLSEIEKNKLIEELGIESAYVNQEVKVVGVLEEINKIITKKGNVMYSCVLNDLFGSIRLIIFPNMVVKNIDYLEDNETVIVKGTVETNSFGTQIIVSDMVFAEEVFKSSLPKNITLDISDKSRGTLVKEWATKFKGDTPLIYFYKGETFCMKNGVNLTIEAQSELEEILTAKEIKIIY